MIKARYKGIPIKIDKKYNVVYIPHYTQYNRIAIVDILFQLYSVYGKPFKVVYDTMKG